MLASKLSDRLKALEKRDKVYIVPTKQGIVFLATSFALLAIGLTYVNNLILIITFINFTLFLINLFVTNFNLKGIDIAEFSIESDFQGRMIAGHCLLTNTTSHPKSNIRMKIEHDNLKSKAVSVHLKPRTQSALPIFIESNQRGKYKIEHLLLYTTFPLALFRSWKRVTLNTSFYVYPRPFGPSLAEARLKIHPIEEGEEQLDHHMQKESSSSDEFKEHRNFTEGDSYKFVDWKVYARREVKLIKTFHSDQGFGLEISIDQCPQHDHEDRLSQLVKWVLESHQENYTWSLTTNHNRPLPMAKGEEHLRKALELLAIS